MNRPIVLLTIFLALLSRSAASEPDPDLEHDPAASPVAPSCVEVTADVAPCLSFIESDSASQPSPACCSGAKRLSNQAKSTADRQGICQCIKSALAGAGSYDKNRIPLIPQKCGVSISLPPIDSKTDCSKYSH